MAEKVFGAGCRQYDLEQLEVLADRAFREFQVYDLLKPGMTVVLKPNLILRSRPEAAAVTHPAFTAAVGRCVKKTGAQVLIAESPGGPYTPAVMRSHFKACGYTDMAEAFGFSLYTDCRYRQVSLPNAVQCRELAVIEPFLERDFLIDLPKLKTHSMMAFSGAVKNMFGAVPGLQKPELHCRFPEKEPFAHMLIDLCDFLKPDFSLVDGIWAMEGDGPTGGERREAGVVLAGKNPFAVDLAAALLLGMEPREILTVSLGARRGLGPEAPEELTWAGASPKDLSVPDFRKAKASSTDFLDRLPGFLRPAAKRLMTPYPKIDERRCVGCGKCAESCPQHIISLDTGKARIDHRRCIRCFCCHEMCPSHVIEVKRFRLLRF